MRAEDDLDAVHRTEPAQSGRREMWCCGDVLSEPCCRLNESMWNSVVKRLLRPAAALCVLSIFPVSPTARGADAFAGAAGFGTQTAGGRGGRTIQVTTLADDGPGSLRAAVTAQGPRTVVFRVGGTIALTRHLRITEPFVSVFGQTAPGSGILIRNAGLYVETHDVIIQHIRVRIGASDVEKYDTQDCLHIEGEKCHRIVVDHCSFSWSIDEAVGISAGAHDITVSWCCIAEPLRQPLELDKKRHHAYAVMLGNTPNRISFHHNLIATSQHRNPRIQGGLHDVRNNVVYNWGYFAAVFSRRPKVNFIANYYKAGPESRPVVPLCDKPDEMGTVYVKGNISPLRPSDDLPEWKLTCVAAEAQARSLTPFAVPPVPTVPADVAYGAVLSRAGCTLPERDAVDRRIVEDVKKGRGTIIDRPEERGGYPALKTGNPVPDRDRDGLPDAWERSHGLDPDDPSDAAAPSMDGYSSLESYIHSLGAR